MTDDFVFCEIGCCFPLGSVRNFLGERFTKEIYSSDFALQYALAARGWIIMPWEEAAQMHDNKVRNKIVTASMFVKMIAKVKMPWNAWNVESWTVFSFGKILVFLRRPALRTSQLQGSKMRPSDTTQGQLENLPTRWSWGREAIRWLMVEWTFFWCGKVDSDCLPHLSSMYIYNVICDL